MIISIGPIELASSELWVMGQIDTFIAELFADFEYSIHATDDEHFKIELWSDSHEQLHVQVIVESLERLSSCTAGNHIHHWGLHFCEVLGPQEVSQEVQNLVTSGKNLVNRVVQDEIQVTLSISGILVHNLLLTVALGQHVHAVRQTDDLSWSHGQFASLGATWAAFNTDDVTTAERGMQGSKFTLVEIGLGQNLQLSTITFQINENQRGTSSTNGQNTTSQGHSHVFNEYVILCNCLFIVAPELVNAMGTCEFVRVWVRSSVTLCLDEIFPVLGILRGVLLFLVEGGSKICFLRLITACGSLCLLSSLLGSSFLSLLLLVLSLLLELLESANGSEITMSIISNLECFIFEQSWFTGFAE